MSSSTPAAPAGPQPTAPPAALPAAERVYAHVKAAILDHTYPGGDLITEGEVATEVGVSRTPVREALLRLEAEGLLRLYPKRGALVVPVSAREAEEVLEARALVEAWAAPRAAQAGPALAEVLEGHLRTMSEAREHGDTRAFVAADRAFHAAVVDAAGNSIVSRLYASLRDRQLCMGEKTMAVAPGRVSAAFEDHEGLLAALRDGDVEAFTARTVAHVASASANDRDAS
jgi:DNA-binding GntR family transcriptional regulator